MDNLEDFSHALAQELESKGYWTRADCDGSIVITVFKIDPQTSNWDDDRYFLMNHHPHFICNLWIDPDFTIGAEFKLSHQHFDLQKPDSLLRLFAAIRHSHLPNPADHRSHPQHGKLRR